MFSPAPLMFARTHWHALEDGSRELCSGHFRFDKEDQDAFHLYYACHLRVIV